MASCINPHLQDLTILNEGYVWSSIKDSSIGSLMPLEGLRRLSTTWEIFLCRGDVNNEKEYFPSIQGILDGIPKSLELLHISGGLNQEDCNRDRALAVILELLEQKHRFPAFKALDFGWKRRCPNMLWIYDSRYHPGFTGEDYLKVKSRCQNAGVELILKPFTPRPKNIYYFVDDDGTKTMSGANKVKHIVHYPYDDYEKICNENGCDPESGVPYESGGIRDKDW
ncbi:hypothetical protein O988_01324 [Pseudogymnoascus sp. VKM F-3808]|nr:hypothetical protein O988_01324 [Pseudogymnoascus sp. VKM F-3808]